MCYTVEFADVVSLAVKTVLYYLETYSTYPHLFLVNRSTLYYTNNNNKESTLKDDSNGKQFSASLAKPQEAGWLFFLFFLCLRVSFVPSCFNIVSPLVVFILHDLFPSEITVGSYCLNSSVRRRSWVAPIARIRPFEGNRGDEGAIGCSV